MKTILAGLLSASLFATFAASRSEVERAADAELNAKQYPEAEKTLVEYINGNLRQGISGLLLVRFFDELCTVYRAEKKYAYLEKLQLQTIDMWRGAGAPDQIMVARSMSDLAHTYLADGRLTDAEASWQSAIEILEREKRIIPTVLANYLRNLANVRSKLGRYDEAEADYKRALQILGDEDPQLQTSITRDYATSQERAKNGADPTKAETAVQDTKSGVNLPKTISTRAPSYPDGALRAYVQGTVVLQVVVDKNGKPAQVVVLEPLGSGIDESAIKAVRGWRFEPGTKDGQPVSMPMTIEVHFYLR